MNWRSALPRRFRPVDKTKPVEEMGFWERRAFLAKGAHGQAFWKGVRWGAEGAFAGLPLVALSAGMAQRGEVLPSVVAGTAEIFAYPALSGVMSAGLSLITPKLWGIGFIGGMVAFYPDAILQDNLMRGMRTITDAGRRVRHFEAGGSYQDTAFAQQQRLGAVQEMSGALGASRRYLGQEAALMHQ